MAHVGNPRTHAISSHGAETIKQMKLSLEGIDDSLLIILNKNKKSRYAYDIENLIYSSTLYNRYIVSLSKESDFDELLEILKKLLAGPTLGEATTLFNKLNIDMMMINDDKLYQMIYMVLLAAYPNFNNSIYLKENSDTGITFHFLSILYQLERRGMNIIPLMKAYGVDSEEYEFFKRVIKFYSYYIPNLLKEEGIEKPFFAPLIALYQISTKSFDDIVHLTITYYLTRLIDKPLSEWSEDEMLFYIYLQALIKTKATTSGFAIGTKSFKQFLSGGISQVVKNDYYYYVKNFYDSTYKQYKRLMNYIPSIIESTSEMKDGFDIEGFKKSGMAMNILEKQLFKDIQHHFYNQSLSIFDILILLKLDDKTLKQYLSSPEFKGAMAYNYMLFGDKFMHIFYMPGFVLNEDLNTLLQGIKNKNKEFFYSPPKITYEKIYANLILMDLLDFALDRLYQRTKSDSIKAFKKELFKDYKSKIKSLKKAIEYDNEGVQDIINSMLDKIESYKNTSLNINTIKAIIDDISHNEIKTLDKINNFFSLYFWSDYKLSLLYHYKIAYPKVSLTPEEILKSAILNPLFRFDYTMLYDYPFEYIKSRLITNSFLNFNIYNGKIIRHILQKDAKKVLQSETHNLPVAKEYQNYALSSINKLSLFELLFMSDILHLLDSKSKDYSFFKRAIKFYINHPSIKFYNKRFR